LSDEEIVSRSGVARWFRVAFDDVVHAVTSFVRPWADLRAVKTTQVDIVKAIADQQNDLAKAIASANALSHELNQMKAREAEYEAKIRALQAAVDSVQRGAGN
jgi:ABC-type transporter Mla subunit MlaD